MVGSPRQPGKVVARHGSHRNPSRPAECDDFLNAGVAATRRHGHILKSAATGCKGFFYSVNAENDLHRSRSRAVGLITSLSGIRPM
jgi:hypothetical protein